MQEQWVVEYLELSWCSMRSVFLVIATMRSHFMEWWKTQLSPNIPPYCPIVLDSASYHNGVTEKIPMKNSEVQAWLKKHGIPNSDTDLKMGLLANIIACQPTAVYLTDVKAEAQGPEVVHLPVAHCELNQIELAWANVKEYVR